MRERLEGLHRRLCRHRAWRFGELLARGYLDHDVGKSAAALAYYLLFSFFPLLADSAGRQFSMACLLLHRHLSAGDPQIQKGLRQL